MYDGSVLRLCVISALAATGCNWVYGLASTQPLDAAPLIDAQYFDAPADAPPACPAPGGEPMFRDDYIALANVQRRSCSWYTPHPAWGKATAYCNSRVYQGPLDGDLDTETAVMPHAYMEHPRVSADGEVLFIENKQTLKVDIWRRNAADDTWTKAINTIDDASYRFISQPTRGPVRRAIQTDFNGSYYLFNELEEQPSGDWAIVDSYPLTELGMGVVNVHSLSSDGLHVTMVGQPMGSLDAAIYWAQRPDTGSRFGAAVQLTTVPTSGQTPYMTDDCSRYYFTGLEKVFYQKQL